MFAFAAVIKKQQEKFIKLLLEKGAVTEETAVLPQEVGVISNQAFRNLIWRKIIIKLPDGRCYVNSD